MTNSRKCKDCKCFQVDFKGNRGGLHGSCIKRDYSFIGGGWRSGNAEACREYVEKQTDDIH